MREEGTQTTQTQPNLFTCSFCELVFCSFMSFGVLSKAGTTGACVTVRWLQSTVFRLCISNEYVVQDPCLTQRVLSRGKYCKEPSFCGLELNQNCPFLWCHWKYELKTVRQNQNISHLIYSRKKTHRILIKISFKESRATQSQQSTCNDF